MDVQQTQPQADGLKQREMDITDDRARIGFRMCFSALNEIRSLPGNHISKWIATRTIEDFLAGKDHSCRYVEGGYCPVCQKHFKAD